MTQLALPEGRPRLPAALFEDALVRLYHSEALDILRCMPAESVDHVITDPPYSAETHENSRTMKGGEGERLEPGEGGDQLVDFDPIEVDDLRAKLEEAGRVSRRWVIGTMDWVHVALLKLQPPRGLRFVRMAIWIKKNPMPQITGDRPAQGFEAIGIFHKARGRMAWNGGGHTADYVHAAVRGAARINKTQKPLGLLRDIINDFTLPGETILDPFCGAATTLMAARELGRKAIGIEMREADAMAAAHRLTVGDP